MLSTCCVCVCVCVCVLCKTRLKDHFRALGCMVKSSKRYRGGPDSPPAVMSAHWRVPPRIPKAKLGKQRKELWRAMS